MASDENRDFQIGVLSLLVAVYFLLSGMEVLEISFRILDSGLSIMLSFVLVGYGVFLLTSHMNSK